MGLDADLIAFYEAEAHGRYRVALGELRTSLRSEFAALLRSEQRDGLVDVGAGPGLDTERWSADGFRVIGLDLAHANVEIIRARGLGAVTGSLLGLPFRVGAFEAAWTMSTLVHVPDDAVDDAMTELIRVVEPGGLIAIGTWGGRDFEGVPEVGALRPYRFFALRSHERWQRQLGAHGSVERFAVFEPDRTSGWEYQFAVVRTPS